ncbi:MAG: hypothetical protein DWG80_03595 [Chloroflexi bacterium]|nr:hypothetical protein [Chloroflexota bacterium]MQC18143.1 hypothetical protein [Chloroflexota bacterium]
MAPTTDANRFQAPAAFHSYRYTLVIEASTDLMDLAEAPPRLNVQGAVLRIDIDGARVNPDREYSHSRSSFGPLSLEREIILIGDDLWSRQAGGVWRQRGGLTEVEDLVGQDVLLSPAVILGDDDPEMLRRITVDLESRPSTPDVVRGRATRRWQLNREWLLGYEDEFAGVIPRFA